MNINVVKELLGQDKANELSAIAEEMATELMAGNGACWDYNQKLEELFCDLYEKELQTERENRYTRKEIVIGCDCLLEGVFVPNMTDHMQKKSMQQRFREMEPDVFDTEISDEQFRDWIYC